MRRALSVTALAVTFLTLSAGASAEANSAPNPVPPSSTAASAAALEKGLQQVQNKDLAGARNTFTAIVAKDPGNKLAWYDLGVLSQMENKVEEARAAYEKVLKIDPSYASALYNEGVLLEIAYPKEAIVLFQRAISANPKASTAYLHLGKALSRVGRNEEANEALQKAVEIDPSLRKLTEPRL